MREALGLRGLYLAALALLLRAMLLVYEDLLGWRALLGAARVLLACGWWSVYWLPSSSAV